MRYRINGMIFEGPFFTGMNSKDFTLEIEGGSPRMASIEARRQIIASTNPNLPDSNVSVWDVQIMTKESLDELGEWILQIISKKWLTENYHFTKFGYPPDALLKNFDFSYVHPGTDISSRHIQTKFPQEITPLIRTAVYNKQEAEKAIGLIFARIKVVEEPMVDGDHHSPTYGQPVLVAYHIVTDEAFELASKTQELRRLIQ